MGEPLIDPGPHTWSGEKLRRARGIDGKRPASPLVHGQFPSVKFDRHDSQDIFGEPLARFQDSVAGGGCVPAVPDLNRREGLRPEAGRGQAFWAQP